MAQKKKVAKAKKVGKEMLLVVSKIKHYIRSKDCMCSSDAAMALSDRVYCMLDKAMERAQANHRTTVRPQDL